MTLEQAGGDSLNKLIAKLKKVYPKYNFDITPEPDTKCKQNIGCNGLRNITYSDREGNIYCGRRYKQAEEKNIHKWQYKECHALLKPGEQGGEQDEIPF